jgi:sugar/nucleoside kinase (ribokinase family)
VTVGHVTIDVIAADETRRPGGGAFYSALQAARLGLRTLIVTQGSPPEIERLLEPYREELELRILPAPATTTLATSGSGAARTQRVLAWAGPTAATVAADTGILHFAPVARETSATWRGHADFVGLTPQGLARAWDVKSGNAAVGDVVPAPLPTDRSSVERLLPRGCDAVVVSEQERAACAPLLAAAAAGGATIAITAGARATSVQLPGGGVTHVQAPAVADPKDDLGAGDVFAAAFFIALHEGQTAARAAAYGNAAAALRIGGIGAEAIGDRSAIEARLG